MSKNLLAYFCLCVFSAGASAATFTETGGELRLETARWRLCLDARTGALRQLEDLAGHGTLLRGGTNLWTIERLKQSPIPSAGSTLQHAWNAAKQELTLNFQNPEAAVKLVCVAADEGPAWRAEVQPKQGTMLGWHFPAEVEFDVAALNEFVVPDNLGLAFTRKFFETGGSGRARHSVGPQGMQLVTGDQCQMRPVKDEPVSVKAGKDAAAWLPGWYQKEMAQWKVSANRCSRDAKHDVSLVETEHGAWLAGYQLGGWGWLLRFGGMIDDNDSRRQVASLVATLSHIYLTPVKAGKEVAPPAELTGKAPGRWANAPKKIGIVSPPPTARPGSRLKTHPAAWATELERQKWAQEGGIEFVMLPDPASLRAALAAPRQWFALINPAGENFMAESAEQANTMLAAIRNYVRNGGVWWEAGGGYSFYSATIPGGDVRFHTANRNFCDFAAIDSTAGRWSLFSVQAPDDIYVPAEAELSASGPKEQRVGHFSHELMCYAKAGETCRVPLVQMVLGAPHREALAAYGRRNGFTRGLADKTKPEIADALKRSILLKVSTSKLAETAKVAESLPYPVLFHIAEYLRGGFDKQYPDHLPPNPAAGTAEDLHTIVRTCKKRGHLFMPYTNPTWWCVNPKGPTFERIGEGPLSVDSTGKTYPESYGLKTIQGYAICAWHPAVRAANAVTREQFTKEYPVDVLFEDQVGARAPRWDWNPAAPNPGAYLEGIHRIAREDCQSVPLGTEDGQDRLINYETMFCGLSAVWLPNKPRNLTVTYEDVWPEGAWRIEPLALFLAHDKVLFYHHDLGGFVRNRLDLAMTLALGYNLSWWTHTPTPSEHERDWLERLCRLQAAIGPRCAGRALTGFAYLAPRVIRSQWGDLEIVANLSSQPWKVDGETTIAPEGFAARGPDLEAGIFARCHGQDCAGGTLWTIREKGKPEWTKGTEN